jgi:hypothetical protein
VRRRHIRHRVARFMRTRNERHGQERSARSDPCETKPRRDARETLTLLMVRNGYLLFFAGALPFPYHVATPA